MDSVRDDYAHTGHARKNRMAKATAVARLLYHDGLTSSEVADLNTGQRKRAARIADQRELSQESWSLVVDLVDSMHHWREAHPRDSRGAVRHPDRRERWINRVERAPQHSGWDGSAEDQPLF